MENESTSAQSFAICDSKGSPIVTMSPLSPPSPRLAMSSYKTIPSLIGARRDDLAPNGVATLVGLRGPARGTTLAFEEEVVVIGRGEACQIVLDADNVSRRHAELADGPFGALVNDLGSTNGTYVNGVRVFGPTPLAEGDLVRVGHSVMKFTRAAEVEREYHEEMFRQVNVDGLTQLYNRRYIDDVLAREVARSQRHRRALSVLLFDIDHFKRVNDTHGHAAGDDVLTAVAKRASDTVRREDVVGRYGGEEFIVVAPETPVERAWILGERIRTEIACQPFLTECTRLAVTVSVGVAGLSEGCADADIDALVADLVGRADSRLYDAKRGGRNRVAA